MRKIRQNKRTKDLAEYKRQETLRHQIRPDIISNTKSGAAQLLI